MNTFLFDLDGTLLPMDQELFLKLYLKAISQKFIHFGLEPEKLINGILYGTKSMIENDGSVTNETCFWKAFTEFLGENVLQLESEFEKFYQNEFVLAKEATSRNPLAKECIKVLKEKGYKIIIATNPLFPKIATHTRLKWAGLDIDDFEMITTYENHRYCKPNLNYYKEILNKISKKPEECMMVGNDVKEDMCTMDLAMDTYLINDCIIPSDEFDLSNRKQGNFKEFFEYIKSLPSLM
jgi:HAD superfamily hydrolase (TIGR01549 family)